MKRFDRVRRKCFPSWPSRENILPELKIALPNADFVIEGYVDSPSLRYGAASPRGEPKHREGFFGDHTGYYTLPEPYPVLLRSPYRGILAT